MTKNKKTLWTQPWGYKESFLIVSSLYIGAIILELVFRKPAPDIIWPLNILLLFLIAAGSITIHLLAKKKRNLNWYSSIPASVGAIVFFVFVSLVMALIPQNTQAKSLFFLYNVTASWAYYFAITYMLIILGNVTIRRFTPFTHKNFGFALSHLGLWITLATASLGAGDVQKYSMILDENKKVSYGYDSEQQTYEFDFAIELKDFILEEFPAKIAFVNASNGQFIEEKGVKAIYDIDTVSPISFRNLEVSIEKHLMNSIYFQGNYFNFNEFGATQSALLKVKNTNTDSTTIGWVGSESVTQQSTYLHLKDSIVIAMLKPDPKRFISKIKAYENDGNFFDTILEVNKTVEINGWKVYQTSYDERKGKWSNISVVEIVRDSWLPYVYFGLFLMLGGAAYLIWFGRGVKKK